MDKAPGHETIGPAIASVIDALLDTNPLIEDMVFEPIGFDRVDPISLSARIEPLRGQIARGLSAKGVTLSTAETSTADCSTTGRHRLLEAWTRLATDPGHELTSWISNGAPADLEIDFNDLDGLYLRVQPGDFENAGDLFTEYNYFVNVKGVDEDPDVQRSSTATSTSST